MALTCSVLGHAYGDPTVERDREERGSEVVVTVREYESCRRCGTTRVVSENKEVTAVHEGDDEEPIEKRPTDAVDVADAGTGGPADSTGTEPPVAGETPAERSGGDPADDGAEIVGTGAGPADEPVDDELASPSVAEPERAAEPTPEEDAVVLGENDEERAPGEWPEEDDEPEVPEWAPPTEPEPSGTESERSPGRTVTVPEGEFLCGECGYTTPVEASSLRAGDFCPECHRGTLKHVPEE